MRIDLNVLCKKPAGMPLYQQLKELLWGAILSGVYKPGEKLESEREIIKQGGLSYPTVSRALRELAAEGWLVRKVGSGSFVSDKVNRKNHTIKRVAVFYYNTGTAYFRRLFNGLSQESKKHGIETVAIAAGISTKEEIEAINRDFKDGLFDALLGFPFSSMELNMYLSQLINQGLPVILLGTFFAQIPCDAITVNGENSGYEAMKHLIDLGYRRVGHVCIKAHFPFNTARTAVANGIKSAIQEFPHEKIEQFEYELPYLFDENDLSVWDKLFEIIPGGCKQPFALICASDALARLMIKVLARKNLKVPQDVSVIGAGNLPECCIRQKPHLTTIEWPLERIGQEAIRLLVSQQHFTPQSTTKIILDTKLIVRDSTGPARQQG
jgi:DNA-binding LacI/PurR family transcriptional regulator